MKKHRVSSAKRAGFPSLALGIVINAVTYTLCTLIFAFVAVLSDDPTGSVKAFSLAALLISGAICGFIVGKRSEGAYTALLSALAFALVMLLVGVIISGAAPGIGNFINYAIFIIISAAASSLSRRRASRPKFKRRKGG